MDHRANRSQVISRFLAQCAPRGTLPLDFLAVDDDAYCCPTDSESVMAALSEEFGCEALVAAGVAATDAAGSPQLVTPLTGGRPIIALRDGATGEPFDLLTMDGCLLSSELPAFAVLRDARTRELLGNNDGRLFVAFSIDDALVLRSSGMAATLAIGLDRLSLNVLEAFETVFGQYRETGLSSPRGTGSPYEDRDRFVPNAPANRRSDVARAEDADAGSSDETPSTNLVLLAWTPSELSAEAPAALRVVADRFQALAQHMEFPADAVDVWRIDDRVLEKLRFLADERSAEHFALALREASESVVGSLGSYSKERPREVGPPAHYPEALQRLRNLIASDRASSVGDRNAYERARRDVERLFQRQVSGPMQSAALACGDPVGRALLMAMAGLTDTFHRQCLMWEMPGRRGPTNDIDSSGEPSEDTIKSLLRIADRMVQLSKAYVECHPAHATMHRSNASLLASPSLPRLAQSG